MIFKPTEVGWRLGRPDQCAGLPEQVWDPVAGCADTMVAERRAKAFPAGTVKGAVTGPFADVFRRRCSSEG